MTDAGTIWFEPRSRNRTVELDTFCTTSLNVATAVTHWVTSVAPFTGTRIVATGATVSTNVGVTA